MNTTLKTYKTSLREIFTPRFDPTTGQHYAGNHSGYRVTFFRQGDTLTINYHGSKRNGPCRVLLDTKTHSIEGVLSGLIAFCQEEGMVWECMDDIPDGFSDAHPLS